MSHTHNVEETTIFGFWLYVMGDAVLFSALFAAYWVLLPNTFGGPTIREIVHLPHALAETILLLFSSFACAPALLAASQRRTVPLVSWFALVFCIGIAFLALELSEFQHLIDAGITWQRSAFLSAFFTLVGTHGLHIAFALVWLAALMAQLFLRGIDEVLLRRLTCFRLFWQFSVVVWVFMFTVVYLMGAS